MNRGKILVVMGGPSSEAEVSRRTGAAILRALQEKGYPALGMEFAPKTFAADVQAAVPAIVFNAVHGMYGEDGRMQAVLDMLDIPYTGSGVLASAITMDKAASKRVLLGAGIATPRALLAKKYERDGLSARILREIGVPVVIKPVSQGSSIGITIAMTADELPQAIDEAFRHDDELVAETFVDGAEITVAVWGDAEKNEAFPIVEITTASGRYDYESKYTVGASTHIIPARISDETARLAREAAQETFRVCGCRGVTRVDMMVSREGVPYVTDINTVPGMTETSLVPDAAVHMGISFTALCERLLALAGYPIEA